MNLTRAIDRVMGAIYGPWIMRSAMASSATAGVTHVARIIAVLAPPAAVAQYVHTCMQGERTLRRWHVALAAGGGFMPTIFLYAGRWVGMSSQATVWAELAWLALWIWIGTGWLQATVDIQRMELVSGALTALCAQTDAT
jgi:hypothetical protein